MDENRRDLRIAIRQLDRAELYIGAARSVDLGDDLDRRLDDLIDNLDAVRHELRRARAEAR